MQPPPVPHVSGLTVLTSGRQRATGPPSGGAEGEIHWIVPWGAEGETRWTALWWRGSTSSFSQIYGREQKWVQFVLGR